MNKSATLFIALLMAHPAFGQNTLSGSFNVLSVQYGSEGEVERFEANFEQHCEGMEPALYSIINYNKDPDDLIFMNGFD